ncbi:hypothetical protein [Poseidonocella sp. HB161398]|uniref:hypothetical protein n=1 Tax=Poseidonocella sp. HB161398 TaxID=2320855 RepID=UPI0011084F58|nr:hypothetical protein [Poseidonocella sp. HB161398]
MADIVEKLLELEFSLNDWDEDMILSAAAEIERLRNLCGRYVMQVGATAQIAFLGPGYREYLTEAEEAEIEKFYVVALTEWQEAEP